MPSGRTGRTCPICGDRVGPRATFCGDTCRKRYARKAVPGMVRLSVRQRLKLGAYLRRFTGDVHARPENWPETLFRDVRDGRAICLTTAQVGELALAFPGCLGMVLEVPAEDAWTLHEAVSRGG